MKKIIIPVELLNPEEERRIILYGAKMARDLGMGMVLAYNYRSVPVDFAYGTGMVDGYPRHEPADLIQERDELVKKTLQGYQIEINKLTEAPPSVDIHILRNNYTENTAGKEGEDGAGFILLRRKTILSSSIFQDKQVDTEEYEYDDVPILVHPKDTGYHPILKIIYGTNYHPYDMEVLKKLSKIFGSRDVRIEALHVTDDLDFEAKIKQAGYQQVVRTATANKNIDISTLVVRNKSDVADGLQSYAFDRNADLIAILMEKQNLIERILQPETINNVAADSRLPVMIFRES
jgi:nucleotide-binding universal stress UspA family protein